MLLVAPILLERSLQLILAIVWHHGSQNWFYYSLSMCGA